jgi:hypothetical protein
LFGGGAAVSHVIAERRCAYARRGARVLVFVSRVILEKVLMKVVAFLPPKKEKIEQRKQKRFQHRRHKNKVTSPSPALSIVNVW